ncbi:MAG: CARDB domain-containing protein, partial [Bacteroidota bacterium]
GANLVNQSIFISNNTPITVTTPFTVKLYLRPANSTQLNDDQVLLELPNVIGGSSAPAPINIPFDTPPGDYELVLQVDSENIIVESDEGNNLDVNPITVLSNNGVQPRADYFISDIQAPARYDFCCASPRINYTLFNGGNNAGEQLSAVYLSTDDQLSLASDVLLYASPINPIPVDGSSRLNFALEIDPATATGDYFLLFVADPNGDVDEQDESNNLVVSPLEILDNELPELSIVGAEGELVVEQGGVLNVQVTVQNEGLRPSVPTDLSLWRVPEFPRDGGEQISRVDIPSIPPGEQLTIDAAFPIRANQR